jgi:hypothetical protein
MERKCGACSECCVSLEDDDRPAFTPCRHLRSNHRGCDRYHERPRTCRLFCCTWLTGQTTEADRPDVSGVLAHLTINRMADRPALNVIECWPGAFEQQRQLVEHYKQVDVCCVMLIYHDGRRILCTRDLRFIDLLREGNACLARIPCGATSLEVTVAPGSTCTSSGGGGNGSRTGRTRKAKRAGPRGSARPG